MEVSPSVGEELAQLAGGEGKETCFTVSALGAGTECTLVANFLISSAERCGSRLDFGLTLSSNLRIPTAFERLIAKARAGTGSRGLRTGGGERLCHRKPLITIVYQYVIGGVLVI